MSKQEQFLNRKINILNAKLNALHQRSNRYSQWRLATFFGGAFLSLGVFYWAGPWLGATVLGLALVAFGLSIRWHRQIEQSLLKHQIWRELQITHLARIKLDWEKIPGAVFARPPAEHPFARDLDLTGERAIHRLLDTAVSQEGSERLRDWLFNTEPDMATIQRRQAQVKILARLNRFRDRLTMYGMLAESGFGSGWQGQRLLGWLNEGPKSGLLRPWLIAASLLAAINIVLFSLNFAGLIPNYWIFSFILYIGLSLLKWRETGGVFDNALILQNGLKKLKAVFLHLENSGLEKYPPLAELAQPFLNSHNRPSAQLKPITQTVNAVGLTQNPFLGLAVNLIIPWNLYFAHRLNQQQTEMARQLPQWLNIWFELEALASLATFTSLNPDYCFPEIVSPPPGEDAPLFSAQNMGHPLLPPRQKVCNNFTAQKLGDAVIITGSNMAGKSSFLRTLGVNLILAYTGGPVNASQCQTILFRLFSALSVSDSVTDGISYFYAEVKRLKRLLETLETANTMPLFYLIDEIFRGTNNRERFIGSQAYIKALVGKNGFGLIATHDLELVKLADETSQIKNYHFRETVINGKMVFDYRLHPGPCPTTNALKIMELEGLPINGKTRQNQEPG